MHRHQADIETLHRDCKREFDSELGGGSAGTCPHCGSHVLSNLSRHIIDYHLVCGTASGRVRRGDRRHALPSVRSPVHGYRIYRDHLHLSIPSSGMTSTPDQLDSAPVAPAPRRKPPHTTVLLATDVDVIVSMPVRSSRMEGPVLPDLLQPGRELSIPTPQGDMSHQGLAAITIAPPAYLLFPFADPFDGEDVFLTPRFSPLPAPLGFAPIGQPGSGPSVIMDTMSQDLSSLMQLVPLCSLGPLSTGWAQLGVKDTSAVDTVLPSTVPLAAVDASVEPVVAGHSPPLAPTEPDIGSSPIVSSISRSLRQSLSPNSVQLYGAFYSATDRLTGQAPVLHHSPTMGRRPGREGPFVAENPHHRIGDGMGGCAYQCTIYQDSDFAAHNGQFGLPLHHPRFLEWVGAPESASLLDRDPSTTIDAAQQLQHDACLMTSNLNVLSQYVRGPHQNFWN